MDIKEFIDFYKLFDTRVEAPEYYIMLVSPMAEALEEFLNTNFCGTVCVKAVTASEKCVVVCAEYLALFFKKLLCYVHGDIFLDILIESDELTATVTVRSEKPLSVSLDESSDLIKIARNAGAEIYPSDTEIRLTIDCSKSDTLTIYAISDLDSYRIMFSKLCEIFFSDKSASTDTPKKA